MRDIIKGQALMRDIAVEHVKQLASGLSRPEKAQLVEWLEKTLSDESAQATPTPRQRSLYGLCADLGPAPTDEDIDEVRREMWASFPREDIA